MRGTDVGAVLAADVAALDGVGMVEDSDKGDGGLEGRLADGGMDVLQQEVDRLEHVLEVRKEVFLGAVGDGSQAAEARDLLVNEGVVDNVFALVGDVLHA